MRRPYFVVAPAFRRNSAGVVALYDLCFELNRYGREAYIVFVEFTGGKPRFFLNDDAAYYSPNMASLPRFGSQDIKRLEILLADAYVIYPEVISGNPLAARCVIRYMLNKEGAILGNPLNAGPNDFIISFLKIYHPNADFVLTQSVYPPYFHCTNTRPFSERTLDATYIGKGGKYAACIRVPGTVMIERNWPADQEQLGILLRQVRFLYTWDAISSTNVDALLCGAVPVFMQYMPSSKEELKSSEFADVIGAEADIVDGKAILRFDADNFEDRSLRFRQELASIRDGFQTRVQQLIQMVEAHFTDI